MPADPEEVQQNKEQVQKSGRNNKHQSVIALDMAQWEELIELFDIKKPMIPNRVEEEHSTVGAKGWYA